MINPGTQDVVTIYTYKRVVEHTPDFYDGFYSLSSTATRGGEYEHDGGRQYLLPEGYQIAEADGVPLGVLDLRGLYCTLGVVHWRESAYLINSRGKCRVLKPVV